VDQGGWNNITRKVLKTGGKNLWTSQGEKQRWSKLFKRSWFGTAEKKKEHVRKSVWKPQTKGVDEGRRNKGRLTAKKAGVYNGLTGKKNEKPCLYKGQEKKGP